MKAPKELNTYCPRCGSHQLHRVSLYKKGRDSTLAEGARRHEREKKGYGGQKYPLQRRFAKTTKKQTLKLACKACGHTLHKKGIRLKKLTFE
ncbi:MAG: 50S ribosomal protein L44e [Candidatus Bathyarchaeota archaeon]|nr:MAG: 50S ribosomal protein L44e [Candidatus Bathyarchaeota archaeon]